MSKFSPLGERIFVAQSTQNASEIRKIKREIIAAFNDAGSVTGAAKIFGVHQLTIRRYAQLLDIEADMGIRRSGRDPVLLVARARIAVKTGDSQAISLLSKQILAAIDAAGDRGFSAVAAELGVSVWALKKVINTLGLSEEAGRRMPTRRSLLSERMILAQKSNDPRELDRIRSEVDAAIKSADGDLDVAGRQLGVSARTARDIAASLGLGGFSERSVGVGSFVFLSRARTAVEREDREEFRKIRNEVLRAVKEANGEMQRAARILGVGDPALRQAIDMLGMRAEIAEKFPSRGKERLLTAKINGRTQTHTIAEWSKIQGVKRTTIIMRLRNGFTPEQALTPKDLREG